MIYRITYDYDGGNGRINLNATESEMREVVDKLCTLGCYNIKVEEFVKSDPCDNCKRQICYGCEHAE